MTRLAARPVPMCGPVRAVVVGVDAWTVRAEVGPLAWCVLEALAARPTGDGDVVAVSVRTLAGEFAVSKNTMQGAVAGLVEAGLVGHVQRRGQDGRLGVGGYRLTIPTSVLSPLDLVTVDTPTVDVVETPIARLQRRRRPLPSPDGLMSLFAET